MLKANFEKNSEYFLLGIFLVLPRDAIMLQHLIDHPISALLSVKWSPMGGWK